MKSLLLPFVLVSVGCQAPTSQPTVESIAPVEPAPVAQEAVEDRMELPRWNHLDRADHAVRQWVRDLR